MLLLVFFALPLGLLALYALSAVNKEILIAESELRGVEEVRALIQKSVISGLDHRTDKFRESLTNIGESSKLILDPDLDSYYLLEVLFISLPEVLEHYVATHESEETKDEAKILLDNVLQKKLFPSIENSLSHDLEFHGENALLVELAAKVLKERNEIVLILKQGLDGKKENLARALSQISELTDLVSSTLESLITQRIESIKHRLRFAVLFSIASMMLLPFISWLVVRNITRRISRLIAATAQTAQNGDLTQAVTDGGSDEVKRLSDSFNQMVINLRGMVNKVVHTGSVMSTSISEIAAVSKQQQATSSEIAATTAELEATSRQIAATSEQLSKTMNGVQEVASETAELTSAAQESLDSMQMTMQSITDSCQSISHKLETLNQRASKIGDVVVTIAKVADQTNLLSLNAAIEAEKAGEFGHGFAVVAREIRRLADQTAVSTLDIEQMVKEIQSAVAAGVMGMEKFAHEVRKGANEVDQASVQFSTIIGHVQTLTPTFEGVSEGMQSQALGARQITESLSQLSLAARQTAESLTQSNSSIEQLHRATVIMDQEVQKFQLEAK